jgi:HEAT repeat-containing protein 5
MVDTSLTVAHTLLLNESVYKSLAADKKRTLFLYEWLCYVDKNLPNASKKEIKELQPKLVQQLFGLFNAFPGPPIRHLIAKNMSTLFSLGDFLELHATIDKCNELLKPREHEKQMQQMAKLCALSCIGAIYEKLGRMVGKSYEDTVQILLKYMKSADSQIRVEIVQTFEKILCGLGTAGQSAHKDIYKQLKQLVTDRAPVVRCASIKCLCEMVKYSTFMYSSASNSGSGSSSSSLSASTTAAVTSASASHELDTNVQLGYKALDNSNYDLRCAVSVYLAQLLFYSINQLQQQQLYLQQQQQMANASISQCKLRVLLYCFTIIL